MRLTVEAGFHDRYNCPVSAKLPAGMSDGAYELSTPRATFPAYAQGGVLCFVLPALSAGQKLELTVTPVAVSENAACASVAAEDHVDIRVAGKAFTQYYFGDKTPKPYLGPLFGEYGEQITRLNFNEKEHVHHRSLWFSHGSVNGVDTWNEPVGKHGYILNNAIEDVISADCWTSFTVKNTWTDHDKKPLCDDTTTLRFYNTPASGCIFDATITLTAAYGDVTLGVTKEAGPIAVRMNYNLTVPNTGRFENGAGGVNEDEVWMKRAPWCDYYGQEEGRTVGVAILDNPDNTRYPTWWHSRNYGLMAPNYFYKGGDMLIPEGSSETFRFRIYTHSGNSAEARVNDRFVDFAYPPKAVID